MAAVRLDTRFRRVIPIPDVLDDCHRVDAHLQTAWLIAGQQFRESKLEGDVLGGVVPDLLGRQTGSPTLKPTSLLVGR